MAVARGPFLLMETISEVQQAMTGRAISMPLMRSATKKFPASAAPGVFVD